MPEMSRTRNYFRETSVTLLQLTTAACDFLLAMRPDGNALGLRQG
jgi:hypothetical protein